MAEPLTNRPGPTNETIKTMRRDIAQLQKRAAKLEQAQADTSLVSVVAALKDIAKAIREQGGGSGGGGYTDEQILPLKVKATEIYDRLKVIDAAVDGKENKP